MSEAGMQNDTLLQVPVAALNFTIYYAAGSSTAPTWGCNGVKGVMPVALPGADMTLAFVCTEGVAAPVTQVVVMVGQKKGCKDNSPFARNSPIILKQDGASPNPTLKIKENIAGTWGFCVAFATTNASGDGAAFYYLPDPELAVGPGPGSDVPL